jgi:hypothetical protein
MERKHSIAVLVTWFGNIPWYFPYFLHSCKFNSDIDFIIFCDRDVEHTVPPNVSIIRMSLGELRDIISNKLDFTISLDFPYKLSDYKPAYGLIFEKYIQGYDYWAQSDIDIIYGNLRNFFTDEMLSSIDYASVRHDYTTGCFSLFRNNSLMNNLFKQSKDYKKVFTTKEHLGFEELNHKHCEISDEGKSLEEIVTDIECFTHIVKKAEDINASFDFILLEGVPGKIKFDRGMILYDNKYEAALYHLYWLKRVYHPERLPKNIPDSYHISSVRVYNSKYSTAHEI